MSEKYLIHSRPTKNQFIYIGHEIVIGYTISFQTNYRLLWQVQKNCQIIRNEKGLAKYSYPSCKVILSSPASKKIQKLVKQQQQETSSERS